MHRNGREIARPVIASARRRRKPQSIRPLVRLKRKRSRGTWIRLKRWKSSADRAEERGAETSGRRQSMHRRSNAPLIPPRPKPLFAWLRKKTWPTFEGDVCIVELRARLALAAEELPEPRPDFSHKLRVGRRRRLVSCVVLAACALGFDWPARPPSLRVDAAGPPFGTHLRSDDRYARCGARFWPRPPADFSVIATSHDESVAASIGWRHRRRTDRRRSIGCRRGVARRGPLTECRRSP